MGQGQLLSPCCGSVMLPHVGLVPCHCHGAHELWGAAGPHGKSHLVLAAGRFIRSCVALCPSTAEIRGWDPPTWAAG